MKMEGLPLRYHSQQLPSLVVAVFLLCLVPAISACPEFFKCGNQTFGYPFGAKKSGCGDPAFQLECDRKVNMPLINISGYQYYIVNHFHSRQKQNPAYPITIVDRKMWGDACNPSTSNHTMELRSSPQFRISDEYINISLWGDCREDIREYMSSAPDQVYALECNSSWYYSTSTLDKYCKSSVQLPVQKFVRSNRPIFGSVYEGFKIKWSLSAGCEHCESKEELCIYDTSNSTQLSCKSWSPGNSDHAGWFNTAKNAIGLGAAIGTSALLLAGLVLLFVNRKRRLSSLSKKPDLPCVEKFLQDYVHQIPCRYSYSQLMEITNNFAQKVGEGGFGVVYKGKLPSGYLVAVKMLDLSRHGENQFMNEVATIGRIQHVHLVRLMGYCFEEHRNALVYSYMPNGSLDKFIFTGRDKEKILNWAQLFSIALGAARGIAYLHQDCDNRIIHFDIKPHNILLDEELTPKIADFGLAKLCGKRDDHISMTVARGTPGYIAPEVWYRNLGPVTDKSDVYSFGMVLLELVGGRKNFDMQASHSSKMYFPEWAFKLMENGELEKGLSGIGIGEIECEEKEKSIRLCKVGMWCIQYNSRDRPSMSRVVQMLEGNGDDVTNPPLPFNSSSIIVAPSREESPVSNQRESHSNP